ncbi:MAG: adenylate/guanylate cyclase domain-containing protein [Acidobacteriota bacterium]
MQLKRKKRVIRLLVNSGIVVAVTALAFSLQFSTLGTWVEQKTYDFRFRLRGVSAATADRVPVAIVAIDEKSLAEIPEPLMLWQRHFAQVLSGLVQAGAGAIGVDIIFSDIGDIDPERQMALVESVLQAQSSEVPIILGYRIRSTYVEQPPLLLTMAAGEDGFGYLNLTTDSDDFVRRQQILAYDEEGRPEPGFALALAEGFLSGKDRKLAPVPGDQTTILINYREPRHFPRISFAEVLRAAQQQDEEFLENVFKDRIVLIGIVGQPGDEDLHATPFYSWRDDPSMPRRTPGVEIHASVISTLMEGSFIQELDTRSQLLITVVATALIVFSCVVFSPLVSLVINLALLIGYLLMVFLWVFQAGWWVPAVAPTAGGVLAMGFTQMANFMLEGRDKRRLRKLFQRYVDDEVIQKILETPESLALQGERRRVAVLFSDIRGFTSRSEGEDAEKVVAHLNLYFKVMVDAIQRNHGMVDKFIGDGIMAMFSVPLEDPEAAYHGVQAAQAMLEGLELVNQTLAEDGIDPIGIGVGIHTGEAVVGNIGSPQKMDYTAIGDVVNTASRIEGLTRKLDAQILISETTYLDLAGRIPAEFMGPQSVKGKDELVPIYKIL